MFDIVHKWSRDFVKHLRARLPRKTEPFYMFWLGGACVGKSRLAKTIHMSIIKVLLHKGSSPEKLRVLLLAPTRVAVININGTTIHTALRINVGTKMLSLNDHQKATLRKKLSEVRFIMIDEISMVSSCSFVSYIGIE